MGSSNRLARVDRDFPTTWHAFLLDPPVFRRSHCQLSGLTSLTDPMRFLAVETSCVPDVLRRVLFLAL